VRNNGGYGLRLGFGTAYRENVITNNTTAAVAGGGVNLGDNYAQERASAPQAARSEPGSRRATHA